MPFTLSHAAAALPFRRLRPIWPALVMGTFAPDIQYFLFISDENRTWHQFPGALLYALPISLLFLWTFEWVVKAPAIELLPNGVQRRLGTKVTPLSFDGLRQFVAIVLWIGVGILTHIVWDQFTHAYSWMGQHWELLRTTVSLPLGHTLVLAHLLQHLSTVGGFLILCGWFVAWYARTPAGRPLPREFMPGVKVLVVLVMSGIALLLGYPLAVWRLASHVEPVRRIVYVVTTFEAWTLMFCIELLIYGLAMSVNTNWRGAPVARANEPGD